MEYILVSFSNTSYTREEQTVDITTAGYFRLGLYGVYTGKFLLTHPTPGRYRQLISQQQVISD